MNQKTGIFVVLGILVVALLASWRAEREAGELRSEEALQAEAQEAREAARAADSPPVAPDDPAPAPEVISGLVSIGDIAGRYDAEFLDQRLTRIRAAAAQRDYRGRATLEYDEQGQLTRYRSEGHRIRFDGDQGRATALRLDLRFDDGRFDEGEYEIDRSSHAAEPEQATSAQQVSELLARQITRNLAGGAPSFSCSGEEPFWSLSVEGQEVTLRQMDLPDPVTLPLRYQWDGLEDAALQLEAEPRVLAGWIRPQACLSSMVDAPAAPYRVEVGYGEQQLRGCCIVGEGPVFREPGLFEASTMEAEDWPRFLVELLPPITACLSQVEGEDLRVGAAWPMNRGMGGVHLHDAAGRRMRCIAPMEGGSVDHVQELGPDVPLHPQEGRFLFVPPDGVVPTGRCYSTDRVEMGGQLIGWLASDSC